MRKFFLWMVLSLIAAGVGLAQTRTITGTAYSSEDDLPIPGVSVVLDGTTIGTVTDGDGHYSIKLPSDVSSPRLKFSFIGFETKIIDIGAQAVINVTLQPSIEELGEVVVTALGISRQEQSLGYAVQQVESDNISSSARTNLMDAINGKVAGVQIQNSGGQAGGGTSMIIRGYTSINYSNQPLYVVDGVPIDNSVQFHSSSGTPSANRAVDLDPNEIESVSILKGGAATALYGIRAGNGAVIITTKKGKMGGKYFDVSYSYSYSSDKPFHLHGWNSDFSRGRYGKYSNVTHWSWGPNYSTNPKFPGDIGSGTTVIDIDGDGIKDDVSGEAIPQYKDNYSRFWRDGNSQQHNLSFTGGSENGTFYASASRLKQNGITPNQNYDKNSFVVNVTQKIGRRLLVKAKANYINTGGKRFRTATGILEGLGYWHNMWDINGFPWKDKATGYKTWFSGGVPHPQWIVNEEGEDWRLNRIIGNIGFTYEVALFMHISYTAGVDSYGETRTEKRPYGSVNTPGNLGDLTELKLNNSDFNQDLIIGGNTKFSDNFDFNYLIGGNIWMSNYDRIQSKGTEFILRDFYNLNNTVEVQSSTSRSGKILYGIYGDLSLGFRDFLFLGVTGRNDWSSTLPKENNSFFYPSVSLSFVASELFNIPAFSFLKVRGSYSQIANDAPRMALKDVFIKNDPNIFGNPRFTISNTQNNPNLKPERTTEYEFGLEMRMLKNLFGFDLSLYNRNSNDQIIRQPVSSATGYSTKLINLGEVSNKGVEFVFSINNPIKVKDFTWITNFNFTRNVGKIIRLGESTEDDLDRVILTGGWWTNAQIIAIEGQAYGTIYGYPYKRYGDLTEDDPGYLDQPIQVTESGQPQQNSSRTILGNVNPDWILGMTSDLTFKGIMFGFTLERRQGGQVVNGFQANLVYAGLDPITEQRWYDGDAADGSDGTSNATKIFGGVMSDGSPNTIEAHLDNSFYSSVWRRVDENTVQDADWWRLRTIYLGYALPQSLLAKSGFIKKLSITLTGKNLWLSTPYKGNDPELSFHGAGNYQGFDELVVPSTKSVMFGVSVTF